MFPMRVVTENPPAPPANDNPLTPEAQMAQWMRMTNQPPPNLDELIRRGEAMYPDVQSVPDPGKASSYPQNDNPRPGKDLGMGNVTMGPSGWPEGVGRWVEGRSPNENKPMSVPGHLFGPRTTTTHGVEPPEEGYVPELPRPANRNEPQDTE